MDPTPPVTPAPGRSRRGDAEVLVVEAAPAARRRADLALVLIPLAVGLAVALPRWWTITLAALASLQVPAEWWWVRTAHLTIGPEGVRWDAPARGYDLRWDEVDDWRLRRIGIGGAASNEWLLTIRSSSRRYPVRSFLWHDRTTMEDLADRVARFHPLPDGWPVRDRG